MSEMSEMSIYTSVALLRSTCSEDGGGFVGCLRSLEGLDRFRRLGGLGGWMSDPLIDMQGLAGWEAWEAWQAGRLGRLGRIEDLDVGWFVFVNLARSTL